MELLTAVFSRLLSMALMALPVMAVVVLVRLAMARLRVPRKYSCALWFAVGVRLVCPVSLRGLLSIFDLPGLYDLAEATGSVDGAVSALPPVAAAMAPASFAATALPPRAAMEGTVAVTAAASPSTGESALMIASAVWLLGTLAMLLWGVVGMVRLKRRVTQAVWTGGEVWECAEIPTPFVLGFFRPRIYIRPGLTGMERTCVLAHERHHIRRRDPWWKLLAWCIVAVYWWNPAVWLCWVLFCRDLEMSCDEAVLDALGDQAKRGYSLSLVENAAERPAPMALAFGEHDAARRVKNVLKWKKETPRVAFLAAAAVLVVVSLCLNGASERSGSWARLEEGDGSDTRTFTYRIGKEYQSYLLYAEVYDHETLLSRTILDCWPLGENWPDGQQPDPGPDGTVTEARSRRGTATLRAELMWSGDGTGTDMQWWGTVSTASGGTMGTNLGQGLVPEQTYWGMGWGTVGKSPGDWIELGEDTAVAVACLSTAPNGAHLCP
ncbi:MAG: M56 family metallopeptidase [Dysosmobacter sp.]